VGGVKYCLAGSGGWGLECFFECEGRPTFHEPSSSVESMLPLMIWLWFEATLNAMSVINKLTPNAMIVVGYP